VTKRPSSRPHVSDPVVTEIVRRGVMAVTEDMKTSLMRTAYNLIIYEALDFTVGLFTAQGETISIGLGLPMFIRGMAETVKAKIAKFGNDIAPGDILLTNDAYITGSHLNHMTFTQPIFADRKLVAFACCMAHWPDVGGQLGGITRDIFAEGLQIPILKYCAAGKVNQDLVELIRMNVRVPTRAMGDLRAQLTALRAGERGFVDLVRRYGRSEVLGAIRTIMDQCEARARERTRAIPDGVYEAESFMDDDGIAVGTPIPIKVRVVVKGDEMTIDLSDVARQVSGFFNSSVTTGVGCAQVAFKCLTSPTDYPVNDGSFRNLKTIIPSGRIVSAVKPAPMRSWMTVPQTIIDTVFKALAPAIPDQVSAAHHADLCIVTVHGLQLKTNDFFYTHIGPLGGGWGAKRDEDGVAVTVCINDGDTHNTPSEQLEAKFAHLVVEKYALITDSGGPGRRRGGLGAEMVVRTRGNLTLNSKIERAHCLPWGLDGGLEGTGNELCVRRAGAAVEMANAKVSILSLKPGDAFVIRSGGGGGFGSPLERLVAEVREDVRLGYVSLRAARDYYGVVLDPETLEVDEEATARRRAWLQPEWGRRLARSAVPVRRLTPNQLRSKEPDHPPVPCLVASCCGAPVLAEHDPKRRNPNSKRTVFK
jgi:N-methylhydantoinase B